MFLVLRWKGGEAVNPWHILEKLNPCGLHLKLPSLKGSAVLDPNHTFQRTPESKQQVRASLVKGGLMLTAYNIICNMDALQYLFYNEIVNILHLFIQFNIKRNEVSGQHCHCQECPPPIIIPVSA